MKQCITFPEERFLAVRPCLVAICGGNRAAGKLLGVFLYRYNLRIENRDDAKTHNDIKISQGQTPDQDISFSIYRKQWQLVDDLCDELSEKTIHNTAIPWLQLLGYLDIEEYIGGNRYDVNLEHVKQALSLYEPTKKAQPQLEKFLIATLQLEKFLIDMQLEKFPIKRNIFLLLLEKVLIANRNVSHCPRGRKPKPDAALDSEMEDSQNLEESFKKSNEEEDITATSHEDCSMPTENIRDFKTESAKLKTVSLHVASSDYQKEEDTGERERERVIRPVLTIGGGGKQHDRDDLSGDWSSLPGAVHDKPHCSLPPPGGVGQTESAGGGQGETAPAPAHPGEQTPDAGTHSLAATPPGDGQDDGTRDQALLALPDAGQVASAPAASTALGVFSPPPTSGVQQGGVGHTPKPRLKKKTILVKDTAGPPPFPSESDAWGTTTCLRLFDFWRGAPLCDLGQLKYASSCAKRLAETYSRVQVVLVRTAMNNQTFWKEQGGADVCDVARHMGKELNKLKMPVAPTQQPSPDQSRPTLEEVECIDPTWCVYQRPGDTQEWILWQGELLTEDEANDRGYGGGGGLYIQTQYA